MNNVSNIHAFNTIIGFILLLFSISYMPMRIESLLVKRIDLIREKEVEEAEAEVLSMEHGLSREQMNDLNTDVTQANNEINQLIHHSASVNDSINALMNRAANEPHLLDTIQDLYNRGILADERMIDSLSQLFTEKSNQLMERIRSFNQKDRDLKIVQANIRSKNAKLRYLAILLSVHFGMLTVTFLFGFFFFVIGLKNWKRHNQHWQDSNVE